MSSLTNKKRFAMTMIELLVCISIMVVFVALLAPAIMAIRHAAWNLQCQSNAKNISMALIHYDSLHRRLPGASTSSLNDWAIAILPEIDQADHSRQFIHGFNTTDPANMEPSKARPKAYMCPVNSDNASFLPEIPSGHYGLNANVSERSLVTVPCLSQTLLIGELPSGLSMPWIISPANSGIDFGGLHNKFSNVAFADGHVECIKVSNTTNLGDPMAAP
jgi:prepilin-type processing-associated H-X9-DG protein